MGYVMVKGDFGLAFVLPSASGGTELVYLTGKPKDGVGLSRDDANNLIAVHGACEVAGEVAAVGTPALGEATGGVAEQLP